MAKAIQRQENQIVARPNQPVVATRVQKASYLGAVEAVMAAIKVDASPAFSDAEKKMAAAQAVRIVENSEAKDVLEQMGLDVRELQA